MKFIFQAVKEEDKKKNWIFPIRFENKSFTYGDQYVLETKTVTTYKSTLKKGK